MIAAVSSLANAQTSCTEIATTVKQFAELTVTVREGTIRDDKTDSTHKGCRIVASGHRVEYRDDNWPHDILRMQLISENWREDISRAADGAGSTAFAVRKEVALCLFSAMWSSAASSYELVIRCFDTDSAAPEFADWQTYRNTKYGYEIRYPIEFDAWPTGPVGERDGRTIRIGRREYSAAAPVLDIRAQVKMPNLESLEDIEFPKMELSVDHVKIDDLQALELTYRWEGSGDIAFVNIHFDDLLIEFDAGAGLRDIRKTPWWKIISSIRALR